ncbi:MAG: hypothetical protein HUJ76_09360 [Parasporobacterium sp.]|nr:hypothetical protein [Parasporobacterium sp.]
MDIPKAIWEQVGITESPVMIPDEQKNYKNPKFNIVSRIGYLIGVRKDLFESGTMANLQQSVFDMLNKDKNARIIRNLCIIRNGLEHNYIAVASEFYNGFHNIDTIPDYVDSKAVSELISDGVRIILKKPDVNEYIIAVNKEITAKISGCRNIFPEWIKWEYIKSLFVMPGGTKLEGIKAEGEYFNSDRNRYPYQCYINWPAENRGNILHNDEKFVDILYEINQDRIDDRSLLRDVGNDDLDNINTFIDSSEKMIVVVDCENSDSVKLMSFLTGLSEAQKQKISSVLLFDSNYTNESWDILSENSKSENRREQSNWGALSSVAGLPLEHIIVERIVESKSQVDMTLAVRTSREVYVNRVDSVLLLSSDSDYWAMIKALDGVKFMVMIEHAKSGRGIKEALESKGIHYCYLDDFYTGMSYGLKTDAVARYIQNYLDDNVSFNVNSLLDEAVRNSWVEMTEKEKKGFVEKYLKKSQIRIDQDGKLRIVMGD